jgi:PAS domain S-box-containing protein
MDNIIPIPQNEAERLKALQSYNLLDTLNEIEFDRLTELASLICGVPIALVSLIDKDRQWFKSKVGLDTPQTPRDISFCQFAIMDDAIFEVNDATLDVRFKNNPLVTGDPDIKFYAGYPLIDDKGYALGTLCVIDRVPKKLTADQSRALTILGHEVVSQIISRKERRDLHDYSNLFLTSVDMVCVAGTDGYFKRINPAFSEILGWTKEELMSKPFTDFIHPDDVAITYEEVVKLSKGIKTVNFTNRYRKKNGEYLILDWVSNPDNYTGNIYAIGRDITEKKRDDDRIKKLAEFQNAILNGTDYSIIATDLNGLIVNFNKGAEKLLGYKAEEIVGKTSPAIFHVVDEIVERAKVLSIELKTLIEPGFEVFVVKSKNGTPDVNEWTYVTKNGEQLTVQLSVTSLFNSDNKIYGYLGIARNITEIKKNQEILQLSEEKHRLFFENAQGLMCTHNQEGKFLSMNNAGAALIGYEPNELINKSLFDVTPKEVKKKIELYLKNIFSKGKDEGLMKVIHKDGSIKVWFYKNVLIKDTNGQEIAIGNAIDISERIETERELKKAKILAEKSVYAKDMFLANMSHEIRTPMNAILGFTEVLNSTKLDNEQKEYLSAISNSGENLMVIINDILDFSKIESGKLTLENQPVDLEKVLDNVKKLLLQKAKDRNIGLNFYLESDIPKFVISDSVRINQILINLLSNAIKFTEIGKVELYCQLHSKHSDVCEIEFIVKDTGLGIPADKLDVIFERFKQADDNTTRKYGGTGLGLSITKKLVELFGGSINVKSKLDVGSEFSVLIPFKIGKAVEPKTQIQTKEISSKKQFNVLLTEDNELNQKLAKHILKANNMNVEIASNGQIAVDILKEKTFDIILMDLQMPIMDGYVATSFIRNVLKLKTPMIAMTAHSIIGEKEKCIQQGMNDYISKPYKAKELIDKIYNLCSEVDLVIPPSKISNLESTQGLYDLGDIIELANGDNVFVKEMIKIFLKEVPLEIKGLNDAIINGNLSEAKRIAHKIKSTFSMFKAIDLASLCNKIEMEVDMNNIIDYAKIISYDSKLISLELAKELTD